MSPSMNREKFPVLGVAETALGSTRLVQWRTLYSEAMENRVGKAAVSTDRKKLRLFEALLSSGGLRKLVSVSAEVLGNPVAIVDKGMSIIALCDELADEPQWAHAESDEATRDIQRAVLAGDLQRVYNDDNAVLGDYPDSDQRFLAARIRRGNTVMGHALVLERHRSFTEEDMRLLPDVCRALGYVLAPEAEASQLAERHGSLFSAVLSGALTDAEAIEARVRRAQLDLPDSMMLLAVCHASDTVQIPLHFLQDQLVNVFPGSYAHTWAGHVVLVIAEDAGDIERRFGAGVYTGSLAAGLSYPFQSLSKLALAFDQASAAIRLSSRSDEPLRVVRYEQVVVRHVLECASARCDRATFAHPALDRLVAEDARCGTDYVHDLQTYLNCGRSATTAARALHVHKNTMYYRIERIENIAKCNLSDERVCLALQIGLEIMQADGSR